MKKEKAPEGWEDTVKKMKQHPEIDNPFSLAWWMASKGHTPKESMAKIKACYKEMVGTNTAGQLMRPTKKESFTSHVSLCEAQIDGSKREIICTILQEGLGNMRDMNFYTKAAIESAAPLFEGKHFFADHPSSTEEEVRPERSVRDVMGYWKGVHTTTNQSGQTELRGTAKIFEGEKYDWVLDMAKEAIAYSKAYPDKSLVGISIRADGKTSAQPLDKFISETKLPDDITKKLQAALLKGRKEVNIVHEIVSPSSADLVTAAGAGGKFEGLVESIKGSKGHERSLQMLKALEETLSMLESGNSVEAKKALSTLVLEEKKKKEDEDEDEDEDEKKKEDECKKEDEKKEAKKKEDEDEDEDEDEKKKEAKSKKEDEDEDEDEGKMTITHGEKKKEKKKEANVDEKVNLLEAEVAALKKEIAKKELIKSIAESAEAKGFSGESLKEFGEFFSKCKSLDEANKLMEKISAVSRGEFKGNPGKSNMSGSVDNNHIFKSLK